MKICRPVTGTGTCRAVTLPCLPYQHQRRDARLYSVMRMGTFLRESVRTSSASVLVELDMSSTVMMDFSSTQQYLFVTGLGTTLVAVVILQTQHQSTTRQHPHHTTPHPQPWHQRSSALTTVMRQRMECMLKGVVKALTASVSPGMVIYTIVHLTQYSTLSLDFVTLWNLWSVVATTQQQPSQQLCQLQQQQALQQTQTQQAEQPLCLAQQPLLCQPLLLSHQEPPPHPPPAVMTVQGSLMGTMQRVSVHQCSVIV